jgi:hypothetical protein
MSKFKSYSTFEFAKTLIDASNKNIVTAIKTAKRAEKVLKEETPDGSYEKEGFTLDLKFIGEVIERLKAVKEIEDERLKNPINFIDEILTPGSCKLLDSWGKKKETN